MFPGAAFSRRPIFFRKIKNRGSEDQLLDRDAFGSPDQPTILIVGKCVTPDAENVLAVIPGRNG
jgi:hypothetical protein